jgi:hypothetical protein
MVLRLIIVTNDGKSALIDLLEKKQIHQNALPESERIKILTMQQAADISRPYLEDFLAMCPPGKANAARKS